MATLHWLPNDTHWHGVHERSFTVTRDGEDIPGVFWSPAAASGARPLILLGHGGGAHKRSERMLMVGELFTTYGWCAAAIDGPVHGDRGGITDASDPTYRQMWQRPDIVQSMIADWKATLDTLSALPQVDSTKIGYWGVSMGTMFGLPFVASEQRIQVVVLGKAGMTGPSVTRSGIDRAFKECAPQVTIPVLFTMQWDDERFDREGQLDLFDRLASRDKRLHAYPGLHSDNGPEAFTVQADFLQRYLEQAD